jgi:hypothetical protein
MQPSLIAELGTHWGEAYFTFCQTVEEHGLSCRCYAIDHWLGDEHAGQYGEEVFEEVEQYNERYYRQFSYLLRTSFDQAVSQFADSSIDLLHIDGLHTYDAVKHDFENWLPKVREGGILLLHDINARHSDFGVWQLWDEIKADFDETFEFSHSWGLGVLRKPGGTKSSLLTDYLFNSYPSVREDVRRHYVIYASHLENLLGRFPAAAARPIVPIASDIRVQMFPYGTGGYVEETSQIRKTKAGAWDQLVFHLHQAGREGLHDGCLRIDPGCEPSFIEVGEILVHSEAGDLLWESPATSEARGLMTAGTACIPFRNNESFLISFGDDPQLLVPIPPELAGPLRLSVAIRVSPAPKHGLETAIFEFNKAQEESAQDAAAALFEFNKAQEESAQDAAAALIARNSLEKQLAGMTTALTATTRARDEAREEAHNAQQALQNTSQSLRDVQQMLGKTDQSLSEVQSTLDRVLHSASWKVTEPIRGLMSALRSASRTK